MSDHLLIHVETDENGADGIRTWPSATDAQAAAIWALEACEYRIAQALASLAAALEESEYRRTVEQAGQHAMTFVPMAGQTRDEQPRMLEDAETAIINPIKDAPTEVIAFDGHGALKVGPGVPPGVLEGMPSAGRAPEWEPNDKCLHCNDKIVHFRGRWWHEETRENGDRALAKECYPDAEGPFTTVATPAR